MTLIEFLPDFKGELPQMFHILCVRPPGGILMHNGVLCYCGNSRYYLKTTPDRKVLKFYKGVLIGTVTVGAKQDATGTIPLDCRQPLGSERRNTSSIGGYGK